MSSPDRSRIEWTAPSSLPEATLDALRASFHARPRIAEAWRVGNRLDPPLDPEDNLGDLLGLTDGLIRETGFGRERSQGWQAPAASEIEAHREHLVRIYMR